MTSILKPWVTELGLRHQGVLLSAIRGCDSVPKDDPAKALIRCLRREILEPFCGDPQKCASFIESVKNDELVSRMNIVVGNFDHYPVHFILHLMHAAEIIGYCNPFLVVYDPWLNFYIKMCKKMHVNFETKDQLESRLGAEEDAFRKAAEIEANTPITGGAGGFDVKGSNPNQADPTRPMSEQLPEAFVHGYFDHKALHVSSQTNRYPAGGINTLMWEAGWHAADKAIHNCYDDPRPRQEGYDAHGDNIPISINPYHGIAKGSHEWTEGWRRASNNAILQAKRAAGDVRELDAEAAKQYRGARPNAYDLGAHGAHGGLPRLRREGKI